ncbi:MAG TPA: tripartite tricarboxylate transporter substrate binding protein [Bryobacteraceae bacterium]|nr:tripartite tricarboxylate transporter substrate binding protein [Bryobacteraceae bacterium]
MRLWLSMALLFLNVVGSNAQNYPSRPIKLIAGFPAGGVSDSVARILAEAMQARVGQPVFVENKPGGSGILSTQEVVRAQPDGYTLLIGGFGGQLIPPLVIANYPVDITRDLTILPGIAEFMNVLTINRKLPVSSVSELVRYGKENPGKLTFGSAGVGTSNYLSAVLFMQKTGVQMTHVPYRGGFGPTTDLLSGSIDVVFENVPIMMGQKGSDALMMLAVTGRNRSDQFPEIPTMQEAGIGDYTLASWVSVFGPPGMPLELTKQISDTIVAATRDASVQEKLKKIGFTPLERGHQEFTTFFLEERARWKAVIDKAGIKAQ